MALTMLDLSLVFKSCKSPMVLFRSENALFRSDNTLFIACTMSDVSLVFKSTKSPIIPRIDAIVFRYALYKSSIVKWSIFEPMTYWSPAVIGTSAL